MTGATYTNAAMLEEIAREFGYKNANVVTALLPRLGLKPPHTDKQKIREAVKIYQAKMPRNRKTGKALKGQGMRNPLVDKLALELFPNVTNAYGRAKIRAALFRGGLDPPWDNESRMRTVLREQGIKERTALTPLPVGNGHGDLMERTEVIPEVSAAREFAGLVSRNKVARFELEHVQRKIIEEVQSGKRNDLADGITPGILAALAALRGH